MKWNFRRLFSVEWLILFVWILAIAMYEMHAYDDPDTPWHYATGLYILSHHMVPTTDPFSWSSKGQPWVTQEWLFEVVFAWLGKHFGFPATWLFQMAIFAGTVFILYHLAIRVSKGNRVMAAFLACIGQFAGIIFWTMRPQIVSYLMFALFLLLIQRVREGAFYVLYWVPLLMLLWANSHGSSTIGIFLLVLEVLVSFLPTVGRFTKTVLPKGARWRLLLAAVAGTLVGLINPNGIKAYTYALLGNDPEMTNNIMEWHSPDFHIWSFKYGVLPFLIIVFLIILMRHKTLPMRDVLYFGGSFAVMLVYQRFLPYVAIASVPLLAQVTSDWFQRLNRPTRLMRFADGILLLVWVVYFLTTVPNVKGPVADHWSQGAYPVGAVNYMEQHHLTTRVLNKYDWGGYLILRGVPTFIDGRTDIYLKNGKFMDYLALQNVWSNAPYLLDEYHFKAILFNSGSSLVTYLTGTGKWKIVYYGRNADVLVPVNTTVPTGGSG